MAFLFGGARSVKKNDTIRDYTREINKHIRSLDRESNKYTQNEKSIQRDIRRYAEKQDITMAKLKAKELIRSRGYAKRLTVIQQGLNCLSQELTIVHSTQQSQEIIEKTNKILQALNNKLDLNATYKMMMSFEKNNSILAEKQEMMSETLEGMFETDDDLVDQEMSGVFEELGLKIRTDLIHSNGSKVESMYTNDIEQRFMQLRTNVRG
jgi:charged multivesicular body protein 2A